MNTYFRPACVAAKLASLIFLTSVAAHPAAYDITDLGTLGGTNSYPAAINASGKVVGNANTSGGDIHPVLFSGTGSGNKDLGTLGGTTGYAYGINASGQIVGDSTGVDGIFRATLFSGTGTGNKDLGTLGGTSSIAFGINDSAQIVGYASTASDFHATLFSGTGTGNTDLGTLGGATSYAYAINNAGKIVGKAYTTGGASLHATAFSGTGSGNKDLGTLTGPYSTALAINRTGTIAGDGTISGGAYHVIQFSGTGSGNSDLGSLGGFDCYGRAINGAGQIVGSSQTAEGSAYHGFLKTPGKAMVDLNTLIDPASGWVVTDAAGINASGQIAATGTKAGKTHALLLSPHLAAPTVKITGKKTVETDKSVLLIKGTTTGKATSVSYRIGEKGSFKAAKGTPAKWKFNAALKPGKNVIYVLAKGPGGQSKLAKVTVTRK
ncbi:MAG: hypothetical protein ABIS50_13615 [Luteolibacter sp.]|uniref:hypothetical protein n=1 Tax=Luteolibacter sp. TaxID=1962973 RepID=UPI003264411F